MSEDALRLPGFLTPKSDYRKALTLHRLEHRYNHHPPKSEEVAILHENVRKYCLDLAMMLEEIVPEGYEKELMHYRLEEVMFWGNASIARHS